MTRAKETMPAEACTHLTAGQLHSIALEGVLIEREPSKAAAQHLDRACHRSSAREGLRQLPAAVQGREEGAWQGKRGGEALL